MNISEIKNVPYQIIKQSEERFELVYFGTTKVIAVFKTLKDAENHMWSLVG